MVLEAEEGMVAEFDLAVEKVEPWADADPAGGSWRAGHLLSRDPLGEFANGLGSAAGVNLYAYVGNSPLNLVDPLGLSDSASRGMMSQLARLVNKADSISEIVDLMEAAASGDVTEVVRKLADARMKRLGSRAGNLCPASLTRGKNFPTEMLDETYEDIIRLSREPGEVGEKAKKVKKIIEQAGRLSENH